MTEKEVVLQFNREVIVELNREVFEKLMAPDFVNHAAPANQQGAESMWMTFHNVLHPALSDLNVTILDQVQEGDKVMTRKQITGTHTGDLLGVAATNREIIIDVIDVVRVEQGKYKEHWGLNTLGTVVASLQA